ncbi:MAG: phosphoribosylamine--glycine ligase [Dehalococcoidia bacterium]|nr:phosphoribosylamine--glycine ligase [Dehalococcoidia bacterium]
MKLLIIGSGAREHAMAWKLAQSRRVSSIFCAPGNAGTAALGTNLPIAATDVAAIADAARRHRIDLVVVGPEGPLAAGLVDVLQAQGVPVFGPTRAAAALEWSKAFAKEIMVRYGIPCARGERFTDFRLACAYVDTFSVAPVIKADGLAQGKGVTVPESRAEAMAALEAAMVRGVFGEAGRTVVIEERLEGVEASVFAFCDGERALTTIPACDYKRALDGDLGPNTGGIGSYSPPEFLDEAMVRGIGETVMTPAVRAMAREGKPLKGVLYAGVMVHQGKATVLEFNCRLGDPETQVILLRMRSDLLDVLLAVAMGDVSQTTIEWDGGASVGVVLASGGYPGSYKTGYVISGLDEAGKVLDEAGGVVFHGGTKRAGGETVTDGGRVLTVSARGATMAEARERAYAGVGRIAFKDMQYRKDIGLRAAGR